MADSGRFRARSGVPYQCLPTRETKPKTKWSCMWKALPNLTRILARGANTIGVFGLEAVALPTLTKASFWLHRRSIVLLPIITGRGVKYTHNDIKHSILHPDSGPTGIRLVPTEHTQKEIAPPHPHDPQSILGQEPAVLTPQSLRCGRTTANTRAKQVNLVMIL